MTAERIRITHTPSGKRIAEGPLGWGIKSFEGNYYIQSRYLCTDGFKINCLPGLCFYKFLYVWMDFHWGNERTRSLGWYYFLPNPLFPFIWFRVAVSSDHPELRVELVEADE